MGMQMLKTFCLARRRMLAPFSLDMISSGARRRPKPRALARPHEGSESRDSRRERTSSVCARRRMRPLASQKATRTAFSESVVVSCSPEMRLRR